MNLTNILMSCGPWLAENLYLAKVSTITVLPVLEQAQSTV